MKTFTAFRVLAALALSLALVGCGGSDGGSAATSESGGGAAQSATVTMADLKYSPDDVTIAAGGEVSWTNEDDAPHTVTFEDDAVTSSEQMQQGDTFKTTFDEAGAFAYVCAIHPEMKATVTVQ